MRKIDKAQKWRVPYNYSIVISIDSLDRLTFRYQLIFILLVVPTGQHLHAIFSFLACR